MAHRTRNDEWCSCFVDQYGVHLIHDCEEVRSLHHVFGFIHHIVTEIVKAEFIIRSISDIGRIFMMSLMRLHIGLNTSDIDIEEIKNGFHPFTISACEIIIDSNEMDAFA